MSSGTNRIGLAIFLLMGILFIAFPGQMVFAENFETLPSQTPYPTQSPYPTFTPMSPVAVFQPESVNTAEQLRDAVFYSLQGQILPGEYEIRSQSDSGAGIKGLDYCFDLYRGNLKGNVCFGIVDRAGDSLRDILFKYAEFPSASIQLGIRSNLYDTGSSFALFILDTSWLVEVSLPKIDEIESKENILEIGRLITEYLIVYPGDTPKTLESEDSSEPNGTKDEVVFTWPDPEPILPYLIQDIDPTLCPNCSNRTMYSVQLHPLGFIFKVIHGQQQGDPRPEHETPGYFIHQIQLFPDTWPMDEYINYIRSGTNLPQLIKGKSYIYTDQLSPGKITLAGKSNVMEKGMLLGSGNDSENVELLTGEALARVPEEGLLVPDMVSVPSLMLNENLSSEYVDNIWVSKGETYQQELSQVGDDIWGIDLWVTLKKPGKRLAAAVYIVDNETFLHYQWMENPQANTPILLMHNWIVEDGPYIDSHQFGQAKKVSVYVWLDGELVKELPLDIVND